VIKCKSKQKIRRISLVRYKEHVKKSNEKLFFKKTHGFKFSTIKKTHSNSVLKYHKITAENKCKKQQTRHVPQAELKKPCFHSGKYQNKHTRKYWVVKGNHFRGKEPIPNKCQISNKPNTKNKQSLQLKIKQKYVRQETEKKDRKKDVSNGVFRSEIRTYLIH